MVPDCTKQSIMCENVSYKCVPKAKEDRELKEEDLRGDHPVIYVGETSRSIVERSREHWSSYKGGRRITWSGNKSLSTMGSRRCL